MQLVLHTLARTSGPNHAIAFNEQGIGLAVCCCTVIRLAKGSK